MPLLKRLGLTLRPFDVQIPQQRAPVKVIALLFKGRIERKRVGSSGVKSQCIP